MNPIDIKRNEMLKAEQSRLLNDMPESKQMTQSAGCDTASPASRERTAREVLAELCMSKQVEAEELNELLKALPSELPWRADRALRRLISS